MKPLHRILPIAFGIAACAALSGCATNSPATSSTTTTTPTTTKQIWVTTWGDAPDSLAGPASSEQTFREIVKPTVGSRGTARLHVSNYFGTSAITLGAVHVGVQTSGAGVTGDVAVTFGGSGSVSIPAGGFVTSDNVPLNFVYGNVLSVTEYVSGSWTSLTQHEQGGGSVTSYTTASGAGNKTADTTGTSFSLTTHDTYLLDRVDVYGSYTETIAAFGGSTTDGYLSGVDQHMSYPEQLAADLHLIGRDDVGIANEGIDSDQLLAGSDPGLTRFSRDVLALPNVTSVIDYIGANDLRDSCTTAAAIIAGKQTLQSLAHTAGIKIYLGVIAPSTFCGKQNPSGFGTRYTQGSGEDAQRSLLNTWIVSTAASTVNGVTVQAPVADGVIDFNAALVDPTNTSYMLPALDSGDDIHPTPTGYGDMAKAVPLSLF